MGGEGEAGGENTRCSPQVGEARRRPRFSEALCTRREAGEPEPEPLSPASRFPTGAGSHAPSLFRESAADLAPARWPEPPPGAPAARQSPSWPQLPRGQAAVACGPGSPARAVSGQHAPRPGPVLPPSLAPGSNPPGLSCPDTPTAVRFPPRGHTVSASRDEAQQTRHAAPGPRPGYGDLGSAGWHPARQLWCWLVRGELPKAPSAPSEESKG